MFVNERSLHGTGGVNYSWSPAGTLTGANTQNPMATPAATTTYTLTATDGNGCTGTAIVTVTVLPFLVAEAGPDTAMCRGKVIH